MIKWKDWLSWRKKDNWLSKPTLVGGEPTVSGAGDETLPYLPKAVNRMQRGDKFYMDKKKKDNWFIKVAEYFKIRDSE